jgi:hypothetical protein
VSPSYRPSIAKSYQLDVPSDNARKYDQFTRSSPFTLLSRLPSPGQATSEAKSAASFVERPSKFAFSMGPSVDGSAPFGSRLLASVSPSE